MKKRILSLFLILSILVGMLSGCTGSLQHREIHTAEDLLAVAKHPNANYILMADIDMEGQSWTPVKNFSGTFNGNRKTISNLTITTTAKNSADMGFFGQILDKGEVSYLQLANVSIQATETNAENIGVVAGLCKGTVTGCTATGLISDTRLDANGNAINVGALVGKTEIGAKVTGDNCLSYTDPAGVHTTKEICADVKLFVGNSELVSYGLVGSVAEGSTVSGQWRDTFFSSERLSENMRARQQVVVDYMYKMATVAWTVPSTMTHIGSSKIHNQTFEPGQTYYGIPYDHTAGSYERFMFCMDENNQVQSWVAEQLGESTWSGSDPSLLGFTVYMGNDCSSAVGWSWLQVSPAESGKDINGDYQGGAHVLLTNDMMPNANNQELYGIYPVGSWNGEDFSNKDAVYQTGMLKKCSEIIAANGEEKIFEAYARARKADALLFGEPGGHARLIAEDPVVIRNADNSIDIDKSYILCHEQGDGLYNNRYEHTNSSWRTNYRYTFNVLMYGSSADSAAERQLEAGSGQGYLPVTIRALRQEEVPAPFVAPYPEVSQETVITPVSGRIYSNYHIVSSTLTVFDSAGNEVYNKEVFTGSSGEYDSLRGRNNVINMATEHVNAMSGLPAGTYTFNLQVLVSDGSVHTVIEKQTYDHQ